MKFLPVFVLLLFFFQVSSKYYLFSYFKNNGEDGLHLAISTDGYHFRALKSGQSFLKPLAGKDKLMRDPCIIVGNDKKFHMVWTLSWKEKGIGYATSDDLINWSEQHYLPVMEHEAGAKNCWAPEIFFDIKTNQYIIFWSTTIEGRFAETAQTGDGGLNHRMYYTTTKDFIHFSDTKLFFDKGFNVIDGTLHRDGEKYLLFIKDETRYPPKKNILMAQSENLFQNDWDVSSPVTGKYWAEGPTCLHSGKNCIVFFDKYMDHKMGAVVSSDLKNWSDISEKVSFPDGARHGTVVEISRKTAKKLLKE